MAVRAVFAADFTAFDRGVEKAQVTLRTFESGIGRIDKDLAKFGNQFSGVGIIQQATLMEKAIREVGGVSRLTSDELARVGNTAKQAADKMKALGLDVPERLQSLAKHAKESGQQLSFMEQTAKKLGPALAATFSIGAITNFARQIGEFAGKMEDLSAETKIGTERLQAFNFQGAGVGLTVDDIAQNMEQLARRTANGDDSAAGALDKLGISADQFNQLGLDAKLFEVSKKMEGIASPTERVTVLTDLFGKAGARMGRLMTDNLEEVIKKIETSGAVIDEELIRKADEFDDAWSQAWIKFRAYAVETASFLASNNPLQQFILDAQGGFGHLQDLITGQLGGDALTPGKGPKLPIGAALPGLKVPTGKALEAIENQSKALFEAAGKKLSDSSARAADELKRFKEGLEQFNTDIFRQGAAANAQGKLGFLSGVGSDQLGGVNLFPQPKGLANQAPEGWAKLFNLDPPKDVGKNLARAVTFDFGSFLSKNLGPTMMQALTGGGSLTKSLGGLVGGGITEKLFGGDSGLTKAIGGGLSKVLGKTIGGALSSALPGIGALAGPAIDGLGKLFGKLFGSEGKKTNDIRDQMIAAAGGIDVLAEKARQAGTSVDGILKAGKVKDFEAAWASLTSTIGAFTNEQEADAQRLTAAISKYGFTFEQAGAAFQKQELDKQAKDLIEDWRVLVGSGIDLTLVNDKMSGAINEYLQTALRVGQEIPNAFRPILQKMLEQGTLTDEAGGAITDMEAAGIHFSETMTQGFDRVVLKLDELIAKLIAAGTAMESLGSPSLSVPEAPTFGEPSTVELTPFRSGTGNRYVDFKDGTPVMLHGREKITPEGAETGGSSDLAQRFDAFSDDLRRALQRMPIDMMNVLLTSGRA